MRLLLLLFFVYPICLHAQSTYDSSFHFYYYDQKLSMFEIMPDQKGEVVWMGDSITDGGEWSELFPHTDPKVTHLSVKELNIAYYIRLSHQLCLRSLQ